MYLEIALCRKEVIDSVLWSKYVGKLFFLLVVHLISLISYMNVTLVWCVAKATRRTHYFSLQFTVGLHLLILIGKYRYKNSWCKKQFLIFILLCKWTWSSLCSSSVNSAALCKKGWQRKKGAWLEDAKLSLCFKVQISWFSGSLWVNSFTKGFPEKSALVQTTLE